jgi:hypothetical protein
MLQFPAVFSLLAYAYLYTGQIQSLGCFLAYCCVFWSHGIAIGDLWMSALNCWQKGGDIFYRLVLDSVVIISPNHSQMIH